MAKVKSSVLGYPRIGADREWKKALEAFWAGKLNEADFTAQLKQIRLQHLQKQRAAGIDLIPVGDFSLYDHILDTAAMFGIVPKRFSYEGGQVPLATYYAIARGTQGAAASEMTKWFNTNYHYIVPELQDANPVLTENKPLIAYREAKDELGIEGKPVLVGPLTFLKLSKGYAAADLDSWVDRLLPLYGQLLQELQEEGVEWVQIDEPIVVQSADEQDIARLQRIYAALHQAAPQVKIMLQTYFEAAEHYKAIVNLPVAGIGLDFVHGGQGNIASLAAHGFPADKTLGAGLIDGRGIWRADLNEKLALLEQISQFVAKERLIVQTSCSLLHVPVTTAREAKLAPELLGALAFADEKLAELSALAIGAAAGRDAIAGVIAKHEQALSALKNSPERNRKDIQQAVDVMQSESTGRNQPFAERHLVQQEAWKLPLLPTTTIGSFPQSLEVRQARQKWRKGEWSAEQYRSFIREQIDIWIALQQEIGLDVLVHGEFERTDMVEFFGEKLAGFAFTQYGWVQSYGSRCVKPPVIYGDVAYSGAMTVEETVYAQSLTKQPVKGMLTGPITILNWSFVREDIGREQVAYQIAYALRKEVEALEQAGIGMIQVDEPALREGLPLKAADHAAYLDWAVNAFKMATCTVADATQIHTHMCYCEFHDMIDAIKALDADVISIETSRSHGEMIHSFEENVYDKGIGLGVYDIHSPRIPPVAEMTEMIDRALKVLDPALFWINPDCGLKTRGRAETVESLRNMVEATKLARAKYH
ncbi:5-methyltetrahydropteroyltriglutamate--homocysteine S-methyltransferase [Paenibacillus sp. GCM10027626]|uniref:5-methyltetrahydropteroyltriglutamate-- homocysteine S-methyltransferase n=1 Tax=Paenibacillus sp. GCM10027626 TaxID=3273411 RepID=UPI00362E0C5F